MLAHLIPMVTYKFWADCKVKLNYTFTVQLLTTEDKKQQLKLAVELATTQLAKISVSWNQDSGKTFEISS